MKRFDKKQIVLGVLVLLFAYIAIPRLIGLLGDSGGEIDGADGSFAAGRRGKGGSDVPKVMLAELSSPMEEFDSAGRNLFGYHTPPPPTKSAEQRQKEQEQRQKQQEAASAAREQQEEQNRQRNEERQTQARKAPPIPVKLMGFLKTSRARVAILEFDGEQVLGREGEVVEEKYRLVSVGIESIIMNTLGFDDDRQRIPLGGK